MQHQFWVLKSPDNTATRAEWDRGKVELESVHCPIDSRHQHPGRRLTDLSVVLPGTKIRDFVWTWYSECLLRDETLALFRDSGFTGFGVKSVSARFKGSKGVPPKLWELTLNGWGGMANTASGIRLDESKSCRICGSFIYTGLSDAAQLMDTKQWDGSDFFMVWPLPRFIFITTRVVNLIRDRDLKGIRIIPVSEIKTVGDSFSPGQLSKWMPDDRAKKLGKPLGIY